MSEERKPVLCPQGHEMTCMTKEVNARYFISQYSCMCGWTAPKRHASTKTDAEADAYLASTRRPENRPLTLPELFDLEDDDAGWVVAENGKIYAMGAECAQEWASEEHCLFFARKPTPEDIEAARKERNG